MRHCSPERIVRLTEEIVAALYLVGEQDRILGVSGVCRRLPRSATN